ncbi:MAG: NYN domain-containing protein [Gemmataceae bacterium]|nr:NYN domain-containing protein [Gemmata sp.]MDW8195988.1 NYN domain-containing protein [Gemmataceae bacterium]
MKSHRASDGERSLAVFIDFENLGMGFNNRRDRFDINKVLERLVEKGKIVTKKAYADWSRFASYTSALHEAAIDLIEIPRRGVSGKNSADIRLVVDAIDLAYSKDHIDTFVIVSGDSDFSPLVSKLKELGKHVIGVGLADATSDLLRDNCDEFIYYEDLDRAPIIPVAVNDSIPEKKRKVFALLLDSLLALRRENKEIIYSSMLKDTIKRKKPSFNEGYYGYRTFSELLEDAQREGLLELEKHKASGMYIVTRFGLEMQSAAAPGPSSRNGGEPKKVAELPKPVTIAEKRLLAGLPPAVSRPQTPPLPTAETETPNPPTDRPLGRALVEDFEVLDDEDPDVVPSYGATPQADRPTSTTRSSPRNRSSQSTTSETTSGTPKAGTTKSRSSTKPSSSRGTRGQRNRPSTKPESELSSPPPAPPAPSPLIIPPPAPDHDEDDFGAGLD